MFGAEVREMLIQVITSWQVIAVTVALVMYISLVSYVARIRHGSYSSKRKKKANKAVLSSGPEIVKGDDELGLDDAEK